MLSKLMKARNIAVEIFTSNEYDGDVEMFQDAVNSWLKSQPDNVLIEDIIYQHSGVSVQGKDIFSVIIVSRPITIGD